MHGGILLTARNATNARCGNKRNVTHFSSSFTYVSNVRKALLGRKGLQRKGLLAITMHNCDLTLQLVGRYPNRLLQVKMNIMPHSSCSAQHGTQIRSDHHICIGSRPTADRGVCYVSNAVNYWTRCLWITLWSQSYFLALRLVLLTRCALYGLILTLISRSLWRT